MNVCKTNMVFNRNLVINALKKSLEYPLTVVEAPMGYGKTTAVKEFLKTIKTPVFWKTITDDSSASFWANFVRIVCEVNELCAQKLQKLGFPSNKLFIDEAIYIIESIDFRQETILVLDDCHLLESSATLFLEALTKAEIPNLHIIIISRFSFGNKLDEFVLKGYCTVIDKSYFTLSQNDIKEYFKTYGIRITEKQAEELFVYSEGWISALYLCMLNYVKTGKFVHKEKLHNLLEKTVYRTVDKETQTFLLSICLFGNFTKEMAFFVYKKENVHKILKQLLHENAFISFDEQSQNFQMHSILTDYLKKLFNNKPNAFKQKVWRKAAKWHFNAGEYQKACEYFYILQDFDNLMRAIEIDKGKNFDDIDKIIEYFNACPKNIKQYHLRGCLFYAITLFSFNKLALYTDQCQEIASFIDTLPENSDLTREQLAGELELLLSFSKYNNIRAMSEHHQKASKLLQAHSQFFIRAGSWTMDAPSVFYMFYSEAGEAKEEVKDMFDCLPYYYQITNGHGSGAEYVFEAEYFYNMGDFENAEISCHAAMHKASNDKQLALKICAWFLQARMEAIKGNKDNMDNIFIQMKEEIDQQDVYSYFRTFDLCLGFMYASFDVERKIPSWITCGNIGDSQLPFGSHPFYNIILAKTLLMQGNYTKLLGILDNLRQTSNVLHNLYSLLYFSIYESLALHKTKKEESAASALKWALETAQKDFIVMPFVENMQALRPLLNKLLKEKNLMSFIQHIFDTYNKHTDGLSRTRVIFKQQTDLITLLTYRERNIANLVASGLSNREISNQLNIAEITVKKTLQRIYLKWNINKRTLLTKIVLQNK